MAGLEPDVFWSMSLDEVQLFFKRVENRKKERLLELQNLATLITNGVAYVLAKKGDVELLTIADLNQALFASEKEEAQEESKQQELDAHKAKMDLFVMRMNAKRKRGGDECQKQ